MKGLLESLKEAIEQVQETTTGGMGQFNISLSDFQKHQNLKKLMENYMSYYDLVVLTRNIADDNNAESVTISFEELGKAISSIRGEINASINN